MDPLTMFSCPFRHDTTLQQHRLLSVTANVTEPSGERTSENLHNSNFVEFYKGEVRTIPLPRTPVNKGKRKDRDVICPGPPNTYTTLKPHDDATRQLVPLCLQNTAPWRSCRP